jgi:hypothetical protein
MSSVAKRTQSQRRVSLHELTESPKGRIIMTCSNIVGVDGDSHRVADLWITDVYPVDNILAVDN